MVVVARLKTVRRRRAALLRGLQRRVAAAGLFLGVGFSGAAQRGVRLSDQTALQAYA